MAGVFRRIVLFSLTFALIDGDYLIRVYLMRAEARKEGANAAYTLEVAVR